MSDKHEVCNSGGSNNGSIVEELLATCGYDAVTLEAAMAVERAVMGSAVDPSTPIEPELTSAATTSATTATNTFISNEAKSEKDKEEEEDENERNMLQKAEKELEDAIGMLPKERRRDYEIALERNPQVVQTESPLRRFLWKSEFNFWKAASAVCDYWSKRREVFGEEKYSHPLRLIPSSFSYAINQKDQNKKSTAGEQKLSAFCLEAQEYMERGVYMLTEQPDAFGRPVVIINRQMHQTWRFWEDSIAPTTKLQIWFYVLQCLAECIQTKDQTNLKTVTIMAVSPSNGKTDAKDSMSTSKHHNKTEDIHTPTASKSDSKSDTGNNNSSSNDKKKGRFQFDSAILDLCSSGVVLNPGPASVHLLLKSRTTTSIHSGWIGMLMESLHPWLQMQLRVHYFQENGGEQDATTTGTPYQANQAAQDLMHYGLSKHHLPSSYGGTAAFQTWYLHRLRLERQRYDQVDEEEGESSITSQQDQDLDQTIRTRRVDKQDDGDEKCDAHQLSPLKRKMRDFHEWAADHLHKQKIAKLQDQVDALQSQQEKLRRRNEFFQAQVRLGTHLANQYESEVQALISMMRRMSKKGRELTMQVFGGMMMLPKPEQEQEEDGQVNEEEQDSSNSDSTKDTTERSSFWLNDGDAFAETVVTRYQTFLGHTTVPANSSSSAGGSGGPTQPLSPHQVGFLHGLLTCLTSPTAAQQQHLAATSNDDQTGNPEDGDAQEIKRLESRVKSLEKQREILQGHHDFLEAGLVSANFLSKSFHEFREEHNDALVNLFSLFCRGFLLEGSYPNEPFYPPKLSVWVLNNCTCFDGQEFLNPVVTALSNHTRLCRRNAGFCETCGAGCKKKKKFLLTSTEQARSFMVQNPAVLRLLLCAVSGQPLTLPQLKDIYQMNATAAAAHASSGVGANSAMGVPSVSATPVAVPRIPSATEQHQQEQDEARHRRQRRGWLQRKKLLKRL